jgi:geranylgeranyl diphosphate synthase type I
MIFDPTEPLSPLFGEAIQTRLEQWLITQRGDEGSWSTLGPALDDLFLQARHYGVGGKKVRSAFCYWTYIAWGGQPSTGVLDVAASLDLLHLSAIVHDDVIDQSDTRRGAPSAHRWFAEAHEKQGWTSPADHYGVSAAIIFGDLLLAWSVALMDNAELPDEGKARARSLGELVRRDVLVGQYLDLVAENRPLSASSVVDDARLIMEYKTARYTVARPAQIGAALAGANQEKLDQLGIFGSHIGRAFQMRDDLLGVFGDPQITGKPIGDDVRSGKKTVLVGYALQEASDHQHSTLTQMLCDPNLSSEHIVLFRQILRDTGAHDRVEQEIADEYKAGMKVLDSLDLTPDGATALGALVRACVEREA